jgi:hypothetical protein
VELLEQVERDVRTEPRDGFAHGREVRAHAEGDDLVAEGLDAAHHVELRPPLADFLGRVAGEGIGRHEILVHEHKDAEARFLLPLSLRDGHAGAGGSPGLNRDPVP